MGYKPALVVVVVAAVLGCDAPAQGPATVDNATPAEASSFTGEPRAQSLESRVRPPAGYRRLHAEQGSYAAWLRDLPLRPGRPDVRLHDGRTKTNQTAHHVVLDVDVGSGDLQQCADAVIRLRAEFLFAGACREEIQFNFTSGDAARWAEWRDGIRPTVVGNRVTWNKKAEARDDYSNFRDYLDTVFMYAGSASLERELSRVAEPARPEVGDVFIKGGFPGHAVLVIDVAENEAGERVFLLAQSYMPAQDIHVLRSFDSLNPWYHARSEGLLETPEWDFDYRQLRRFAAGGCDR